MFDFLSNYPKHKNRAPATSGLHLSLKELQLVKEWFNILTDLHPRIKNYLEDKDHTLMEKILVAIKVSEELEEG